MNMQRPASKDPTTPLSIRKNLIWNSVGSLMYQGCLWLTTILVVVLSSSYENSGFLAYAMAIGNLFSSIALYGTRTVQVSDFENKYSQQNYFAFRLLTTGVSFVVFTLYSLITTSSSPQTIAVVIAYMLFKGDEAFSNVCQGAEQKADRMDYIGKSLFVRGLLVVSSFSLMLIIANSLVVAVFAMFVCCACMTFAYDVPHAKLFGSVAPTITKQKCLKLLSGCAPAVLSNLLCAGVVSISRQIFGLSYGQDALGIYAAVATPAVLVQTLAALLYAPILTTVTRKWHTETIRELAIFILQSFAKMAVVVVAAFVFLDAISDYALVLVYGQSIAGYTYLFSGVLVISACIVAMWFLTDIMIVLRRMRDILIFNAVSFLIALASVRSLIRCFYMSGLNYSIILSLAVGIVVGVILLVRFLKTANNKRDDVKQTEC